MSKLFGISILAAVMIAGCGGSSNHTSEWTKAQIASAESEFANTEGSQNFTSAQRACFLKGVEAHFSPTDVKGQASSGQKEEVKRLLLGCGLHLSSSSNAPISSGKTFGPACQKELVSAACAEEQEQRGSEEVQRALNEGSEEQAQTPTTSTPETATTETDTTQSSEVSAQPYGAWDAEKTKGLELLLEAYSNKNCVIHYVEEHESPPGSSLQAEELAKQGAPSCNSEREE